MPRRGAWRMRHRVRLAKMLRQGERDQGRYRAGFESIKAEPGVSFEIATQPRLGMEDLGKLLAGGLLETVYGEPEVEHLGEGRVRYTYPERPLRPWFRPVGSGGREGVSL